MLIMGIGNCSCRYRLALRYRFILIATAACLHKASTELKQNANILPQCFPDTEAKLKTAAYPATGHGPLPRIPSISRHSLSR